MTTKKTDEEAFALYQNDPNGFFKNYETTDDPNMLATLSSTMTRTDPIRSIEDAASKFLAGSSTTHKDVAAIRRFGLMSDPELNKQTPSQAHTPKKPGNQWPR